MTYNFRKIQGSIPAGNRTYLIDVRVAKNNMKYLTITQTEAQGKQCVIDFSAHT